MVEDERARRTELISRAEQGLTGQGAIAQMMGELKDALDRQKESAAALGNRIWGLNVWLLVFTIAIFVLTIVQALPTVKVIGGD